MIAYYPGKRQTQATRVLPHRLPALYILNRLYLTYSTPSRQNRETLLPKHQLHEESLLLWSLDVDDDNSHDNGNDHQEGHGGQAHHPPCPETTDNTRDQASERERERERDGLSCVLGLFMNGKTGQQKKPIDSTKPLQDRATRQKQTGGRHTKASSKRAAREREKPTRGKANTRQSQHASQQR